MEWLKKKCSISNAEYVKGYSIEWWKIYCVVSASTCQWHIDKGCCLCSFTNTLVCKMLCFFVYPALAAADSAILI